MNTIKELTKLSNGKELDIKYPIELFDKDGNKVYYENSTGYWWKCEYQEGTAVYYENGFWWKDELDKDGNKVYSEGKTGFWEKREYRDGIQVYYEDSNGYIVDNRKPVDMTMEEVCKELGRNVRIVG